MRKADTKALSVLTAVLTSIPLVSMAQPADNRSATIEEVIVTAQKVEESLQDTPVSVAAFSQDDLEQIGVSEASDVAKFTPNLTMRKQTASQDNYAIAIRGVSSGETALAIDPTVGIYHDGVYIARSTGAAFDIVDLQRIKVLRGPQGTLFGRNTIGGAINIITQKPRGEFAFKQGVSYGARDSRRYQTTIDTPALGDVAAKLSFLRTSYDGEYRSLYGGGQLGQGESNAFRLAVNWAPTEQFMLDYSYDKSDRENNPNTQQLSFVRPGHVAVGGAIFRQAAAYADDDRVSQLSVRNSRSGVAYSDIDGHSLTAEWVFSENLTMKWIGSYREWDSGTEATDFGSFPSDGASVYDTTGRYAAGSGFFNPVLIPAGALVPTFDALRESAQRQNTHEFQFIGNAFDSKLNYIAGLYYFEEKAEETNPQFFTLPAPIAYGSVGGPPAGITGTFPFGVGADVFLGSPFFAYETDNSSWAAFGQFTYTATTNLDITLGLRYTEDEKETVLTNQFGASGVQTYTDDDSWTKFNPSLTVDYRWNEQLSTYAKVATGYRSGGYNVRSSSEADFRNPFDEEDVVSYEIGWKSDLLDRRLRLNGSIFHLEYSDRQIAQFAAGSGGASTVIVNAGESTTTGLEVEGMWQVTQGLRLIASYGYLDLEYDEVITGEVNRVTGFPTGVNRDIADDANTNLYAPENSASLAVEYEFAPWSFGQLRLRADAYYTDEISFHPQFDLYDESDEHHVVNARATLADIPMGRDGTLKLSAWGKNLENKEYRDFGIDFGSLGIVTNTYAPLRSWGLDIVYEFNR